MIKFLINLFKLNKKKKNKLPYNIEREQIDGNSKLVTIHADRPLKKSEILEILKNEINGEDDE